MKGKEIGQGKVVERWVRWTVEDRKTKNRRKEKWVLMRQKTKGKNTHCTVKKKERGAQARGEKRRRTQVCHKYVSMCVGRRPEHYSQCHYRSSAHKHLEIFTKAAPA